MSRVSARLFVFVLLTGVFSACAGEVPIVEVAGECGDVFDGQICTWARMQGDTVVDLGATVPIASIESAPAGVMPAWPPVPEAVLSLPAEAQARTGLTELTVFWEAMGHPPATYMTPHFDFHFYSVSADERMAISCADLSKPSDPPAGYSLPDVDLPPEMADAIGVSTLIGLCVPEMGMHALPSDEIDDTDPFGGTMVVGYSAGSPIFIEPMISQAMLMEQSAFGLPVPSVPGAGDGYPTTFLAEYDAEQRAYRFVFSGFAPGN